MRVPYKPLPIRYSHEAIFPEDKEIFRPILHVRLSYPLKHSPPSARFEAFVDSGSDDCYFRSEIGTALGIDIGKGPASRLGAITTSQFATVHFHDVALHVPGDIITIKAGFADQLAVAGILGRRGFFDNFIVTFDHRSTPPEFEFTRIRHQ